MRETDKESLAESVYRDLAHRIRTCQISPGEMLVEGGLALHYGVSKTPVREALHRLVEDGTVEKYARAGYLVRTIAVRDVLEGYHLRALLEGEAAALAAAAISGDEVSRLLAMLPERDKLPPPSPAAPYLGSNRDFHLLIADASRNQRLLRMVQNVYDDMLRVTLLDPYMGNWTDDGYEEHRAIVDALQAHDGLAAKKAMVAHIDSGLARVLRGMA